jgi:hypothetical protein
MQRRIQIKSLITIFVCFGLITSQSSSTSTSTGSGSSSSNTGTGTTPTTSGPTNTANPGALQSNTTNGTNATNSTNNTEVYIDEFKKIVYRSSLTKEQREEYVDWISYKDSFSYSSDQYAKLTKYFTPEDKNYYKNTFKNGWPFYTLAGIFGLLLIIYLSLRFILGKFRGPKSHVSTGYGKFTYGLIGILIFKILNRFWIYCYYHIFCSLSS